MNKYTIGVSGFTGYSGVELLTILARHPHVEPVLLEHRADTQDKPVPRGHQGPRRIPCTGEAVSAAKLDAVLLATHQHVSMELAPVMLAAGAKVIDLSGAFRLRTVENYQRWYGEEHTQPALLAEAVYGLPEQNREQIRNARLIANPGCYPTAASLAIAPLVGLADLSAGIVCDAKSGVSGAGRKPTMKNAFCEVTENFSAYSALNHRHVPEVLMNTGLAEPQFSFTAQLIPCFRGILETIYFRALGRTATGILAAYEARYANEPFVRLYDHGGFPDLASVNHTNFCDIGFKFDAATGRGLIVTAIDNLVKGAAGQAVQNLNLILGLPETEGLL
ncbi:MAG: N-acetyl-gamma-glutamyl-phosphate reductase [Acidobacteria bacterium]|nr:N-acetyl-gamma-glutamyl-phosphate reductase [Acidobacteriota bacterium]